MSTARVTPARWLVTIGLLVGLLATFALFWSKFTADERSAPAAPPAGGKVIADFTLPDLNGQPVKFTEFAAGRPAVVSFGTTSCPFCDLQLKAFKELRNQFGDKVALLEIYVGEQPANAAAHVQRHQSPIKSLIDADRSVFDRYGSEGVPVTVVMDGSGRILELGNYIPASRISELLRIAAAQNARSG